MSRIDVRHLSKSFGKVPALDDVSFTVPEGSLMALLGPSGGGKSTALRVITGLESPDSGSVLIDGTDVTGVPVRSRNIGFCFQHYAPFRHMTVAENVAFGLTIRHRPKAEIRSRVNELLELVRLDGLGKRYPSQLSGGQRQRMALARALAVEPKVLLLDEPFGALDAQVRHDLRAWLRDLVEHVKVTTVLVTHDQEEAMEVADQIAIINHGRLEQVGTPAACYDHPANDFVLTFLGSATRHNGQLVRPHDLVLSAGGVGEGGGPGDGVRRGRVRRVTLLGFDARVEVDFDDETTTVVQLARRELEELEVKAGDPVAVSLNPLGSPVLVDAEQGT